MRASFKPFFLGILFTSITWAIVLYFYVSLNPTNSTTLKHSLPFVTDKVQSSSPAQPNVISNYLDEFKKDKNQKGPGAHFKTKAKSTVNDELEANLGLVRNTEDQKIREDGYSHHAFNVLVSSRLDYHRKIPDSRHKMYLILQIQPL